MNIIKKIKALSLVALLGVLMATTTQSLYAQCTASVNTFPATMNGVTVTFSSTSPVTAFATSYTACFNTITIPANSQFYGQAAYSNTVGTYTFSSPVNNVVLVVAGMTVTESPAEQLTFTTNTGTPSLTFGTNCQLSIAGNVLNPTGSDGNGQITVTNSVPFTQLTLTHTQNPLNNGLLVGFCTNSVFPACTAGTAQVALSGSTATNTCPASTVNLNSLVTSSTPSGASLVWFTNNARTGTAYATPTAAEAGTYYAFYYDATNNCYNTATSTAAVTVTTNACSGGTIDCAKTQIYTAPVVGQAGQKTLVVTIDVTTPGCFTPITVSGSGMSLANGASQVCATNTGIQQFSIPVNYNGSALGTTNFTIGNAGSCSANLTLTPKKAIADVWTLECVPTVGPSLK